MDQPPESHDKPESLKPSLPIEETPVIEPIDEHPPMEALQSQVVAQGPAEHPANSPEPTHDQTPVHETHHEHPASSSPVKHTGSGCGKVLGNAIFFILLFGLGVWLSTQIRSLLTPILPGPSSQVSPSPSTDSSLDNGFDATGSATSGDGWTSYPLGASVGEKGVADAGYQLPDSVVAPVCDSTSCSSRGTNLPGGTRFTVAMRGTGYSLPDFRGAILTDTTGKKFTMKQTTVGGKDVYEYTGDFSGSTSGGYSFTKMRGVLVPITATTSVDFNHFSPTGITSDFVADDALFNQIVTRLVVPAVTQ